MNAAARCGVGVGRRDQDRASDNRPSVNIDESDQPRLIPPIVHSNGASRDTAGSTRRRGSPSGISISAWRSPSSRTAKACLISKRVYAPCSRCSIYHVGIRARLARSTIADGNETRDWRIHADFAHSLTRAARVLYVDEPLAVGLADTVYPSTRPLSTSVFPCFRGHALDGTMPP